MNVAEFLTLFGTTQIVLTGLASYLGKVWLVRVTERIKQDHRAEITRLESKLDRALQFDKTELAVWEQLRKDIAHQMWTEYREIMKSMTAVHLKMQEYWRAMTDEDGLPNPDLWAQLDDFRQKLVPGEEPTVEKYRHLWRNHSLISPEGERIGQVYLSAVYEFMGYMHSCLESRAIDPTLDRFGELNEKLFDNLWEFKKHAWKQFGLEKVIPWMVRTSGESQGENDADLERPT
jgi:hypothetical protein